MKFKKISVGLIFTVIILIFFIVCISLYFEYRRNINNAIANYRASSHEEAVLNIKDIESAFTNMYQGLRTTARLPGVRSIDRYANNFDKNARISVQEVYNNLTTNISLSEMYIVPSDFNPNEIDPNTGKLQEPIATFDKLIVGRFSDTLNKEIPEQSFELEEIEIHEYRLMKEQISWFNDNYSNFKSIDKGIIYPAVSGKEVIICDNSKFSPHKPDNEARKGIVYSVPFYNLDGELKGIVSGVLLSHALRKILNGNFYVLQNQEFSYNVTPKKLGQWNKSFKWVLQGQKDPDVIYSEVISLNVQDKIGKWQLWVGKPDRLFYERPDIVSAKKFFLFSIIICAFIGGSIIAFIYKSRRHSDNLENNNQALNDQIDMRKKAQIELLEVKERYELAVKGANDGIWDWDIRNDTVFYSNRWKSMLGYDNEDIDSTLTAWFDLIHRDDIETLESRMKGHIDGKNDSVEDVHRIRVKDGSYKWVLCRGLSVFDENNKVYRVAGSQTDITKQKVAEEKLKYDAFHDSLTDLPNRIKFMSQLDDAILLYKKSPSFLFGVMFLDLDRFKLINDSLGHLIGDKLLKEVALRLRMSVDEQDIISRLTNGSITRLGGDEFCILIENYYELKNITTFAENIQKTLSSPYFIDDNELSISVSIGIALSSTGYEKAEDMIRDADTAMYKAKEEGRARFSLFDEAQHTKVIRRVNIETDLNHAIVENEFELYYQPIVELETKEIVALEALLRWNHPEKGVLLPGEFLGVAEETGLINILEEKVINEACDKMNDWIKRFEIPLKYISVNIYKEQFISKDIVNVVKSALAKSGLPSSKLNIEITEKGVSKRADSVLASLKALKNLGVSLCLDNFGVDHASLGSLYRYPFDSVKVDRFFINKITKGKDEAKIVNAICSLAHDLKLQVVAEGIELEEQLDILCRFKCDYWQGFLFSKPLPAREIEKLFRTN